MLDMKTEEAKDKQVRSTWCALLLHNLIIRYRQALAASSDLTASSLEELDGGRMEFEGILAHVNMGLGTAIKPYKTQLSAEECAEVMGESSSDDEVALADGGSVSLAAGVRGRGSKRGRARGPGRGGMSKVAKHAVAMDHRTLVAADVYFTRFRAHPVPTSAVV